MARFEELFGRPPQVMSEAHGRVNLIGEHTDYNDGFVLPMQIPQCTRAALAIRSGAVVRLFSEDHGMEEFELGHESRTGKWIDYVQGITTELRKQGYAISGFEASIQSTVPTGSGVSSSAALEISILRALRQLFQLAFDDVQLALIGHRAEYDFVGARVGIMDQMVVSLGGTRAAFFLDTQTLQHNAVSLPESLEVVVIDSGIKHQNREGSYNLRRTECEKAAALLKVKSLRDLSVQDLIRIESLPQPFSKRARHVFTENDRVLRAVSALEHRDLETLGQLLNESHASMRDDYEVSTPQIDNLVQIAQEHPAVFGARMTGGGFGGAVVIAAEGASGEKVAADVTQTFNDRNGSLAVPLVPLMDPSTTTQK